MITLICSYKYDNNYDYVKMFSSKQEQDNYFRSLTTITYDDENYIKEHESFLVDISHEALINYGVNYVIFNNGYKDIYAFIVSKEYVNDSATRLHFEIDVIQTYMFDFTVEKSFIERKKCNIEEITDFDEGLYLGEHIIENETTVFTKEYDYFGMFNGIKEQAIVFDSYGKFQNCIETPYVTAKPMTIIDGIQYPLFFMPLKESYADVRVVPINPDIIITDGVVGSARKLLGKPYVYGGNYPPLGTSLGTDCSGLVMWAYNDQKLLSQVGLQGRWTTFTMYEHTGGDVSIREAKAGDVVYSNFKEDGRPYHVVMITNVNIDRLQIIEAQTEGVPIKERQIDFNPTIHKIGRLL